MSITFGYSPCPNDTFSFHALSFGLVPVPDEVRVFLADVEELNRLATRAGFELTKLSFPALFKCLDRYALLSAGSALGRGVGPLLVTRQGEAFYPDRDVVAVPGLMTTAYLLLCLYLGREPGVMVMEFSEIMDAVEQGRAKAGLLIHEGRFTFRRKGLSVVRDLGSFWESKTGLPIPLGCIAARRDMGREKVSAWERALAASVVHAMDHPEASARYVAEHAQEMEPGVQKSHIGLYVNEFSRDLGAEGLAAVQELYRRGAKLGIHRFAEENLLIG